MRDRNRAAEVAAELVVAQLGHFAGGVERTACIQGVVPQEFIRRAMEGAAAALGVDRNHDARIAAVLGIEGARLQLELTDSAQANLRVLPVVGANCLDKSG